MRPLTAFVIAVIVTLAVSGCQSSSNSPSCSFDDPATLAPSAWPKFRHDVQNTGSVANPLVASTRAQLRWMFPPSSEPPKGPFAASPVLNGDAADPTSATRIYIGSTDGRFYVLNPATGEQDTSFDFATGSPITSTALVAVRDGMDAIFFGSGDGHLDGLDSTAMFLQTNWPTALTGFISSSPSIGAADGTLYAATLSGTFFGDCPNGIARFALSILGVQSSPAVGADGTVYIGADDQQLRAVEPLAGQASASVKWGFSTSGPILTAPVVDPDDGSIYVADRRGRVFKVTSAGAPNSAFVFMGATGNAVGPISSSPALAANHLYFGSDDGNLYAVDKQTGMVDWAFPTGAEVVSSPAVATGGTQPVVIVGSIDGNVYFIQDNGSSAPTPLRVFSIGAPVRSSPAIASDGTVYIGADDGRLYAIQ